MLALVLLSLALPPAAQARVVKEAQKATGVRYDLGGRLRTHGSTTEGLDCQGLVFFALQSISRCGWRSWSVMPTTSVHGELGTPVDGASPVAVADLAARVPLLEPGDVVWFVAAVENPAEAAIATLGTERVWVWHVGLYIGDGKVISGDPFSAEVHEDDLVKYVTDNYAGIYVTRMKDGPHATQCKQHALMKLTPR